MKTLGMILRGWLWAFSIGAACLAAQEDLQDIKPEDAAKWNSMQSVGVTADGRWLTYLLVSEDRENVVAVLHSIRDETERRYQLGPLDRGAGELKISPSGQWIAFQEVLGQKRSEDLKGGIRRTTVRLVEPETDRTWEFSDIKGFSFVSCESQSPHDQVDDWIVLEALPANVSDAPINLILRKLDGSVTRALKEVTAYAFNNNGQKLAWVGARGLQLLDLNSGLNRILDARPGARYTQPVWSDRGGAVAALRREGDSGPSSALLAFTRLGNKEPRRSVFVPERWKGFPAGYEISEDALRSPLVFSRPAFVWRQNEDGIFFGIKPVPRIDLAKERIEPDLVLWHGRDERLPRQKQLAERFRPQNMSFVSLKDGRYIQLSDDTLQNVEPQKKGPYVLGFDTRPYGWLDPPAGMNTVQSRDYYLVDLPTGRRHIFLRNLKTVTLANLSAQPQLSPDGSQFLYQDQGGDYIVKSVFDDTERNLTSGLPAQFYYRDNDPKFGRQPRNVGTVAAVLFGWADDGDRVLISDYYDLWALSLRGARAINLTGNGRQEGISYQLLPFGGAGNGDVAIEPEAIASQVVSLREPLYFAAVSWGAGKTGLARRLPGSHGAEMLDSQEANTQYYKARQSDVFVVGRMTSDDWNYYLLDVAAQRIKKLTDANPQQRKFRWPARGKLLSYTSPRGERLRATLYLPIGYQAGHAYPTIVSIYEREGDLPMYIPPWERQFSWMQQGYAVLYPDIQPRFNGSGEAALEGVIAGVHAAVATGVVDQDRLGLIGHSQGGYETYFIVSKTHLFKAAIPESGITNLISAYNGIYGADGVPESSKMEGTQPYMTGPWWDNWEIFLANSPIFHARDIDTPLLIVHGDQDNAVPFSQAVELFNTLRRMGKESMVLLEYVGEDHVYSDRARRDINRREDQFLAHFLKGARAPPWWSDGVSYYQGQAPASDLPTVDN